MINHMTRPSLRSSVPQPFRGSRNRHFATPPTLWYEPADHRGGDGREPWHRGAGGPCHSRAAGTSLPAGLSLPISPPPPPLPPLPNAVWGGGASTAVAVAIDVTNAASINAAVDTVAAGLGQVGEGAGIDVLVNNAGIMPAAESPAYTAANAAATHTATVTQRVKSVDDVIFAGLDGPDHTGHASGYGAYDGQP